MNLRFFGVFVVIGCATLGCDRFQQAGPVECEALYNHVTDISLGERTKGIRLSDEDDSPADSLARAAVSSLGRALLDKLGEKDKYLAKCQTMQTKGDVRKCLSAHTLEELKACGAM